ncbi:hypothetical protein [Photorhabdus cinerea]|nr:hypothetical protein [Photorhabdus cinerea]
MKKVGEEMLEVVLIIADVAVVILVTVAVAAALIALGGNFDRCGGS